jgi:hypothetical protein
LTGARKRKEARRKKAQEELAERARQKKITVRATFCASPRLANSHRPSAATPLRSTQDRAKLKDEKEAHLEQLRVAARRGTQYAERKENPFEEEDDDDDDDDSGNVVHAPAACPLVGFPVGDCAAPHLLPCPAYPLAMPRCAAHSPGHPGTCACTLRRVRLVTPERFPPSSVVSNVQRRLCRSPRSNRVSSHGMTRRGGARGGGGGGRYRSQGLAIRRRRVLVP